jgi:adenylate kinase family enzyme
LRLLWALADFRQGAFFVNRLVMVSGLPATGKSTIARALAASLAFTLLDKDAFLEALFEVSPVHDADARKSLSRQADDEFRALATRATHAVMASWWKHPRSTVDSGTPTEWLAGLAGTLVEVHCHCSPAVAAKRFLSRRRHPGHLDDRWAYPELLASFKQQASLGPLGLGRLIEVDTEGPVNTDAVTSRVAQAFSEQVL